MKEFFGFGGYKRAPEGFLSWQHLTFVLALMAVMIFLAVLFGQRNKNADMQQKKRVLIVSAFLIDGFEIIKIVMICWRGHNPMGWLTMLPLFLCSIQLITIPLAAFSKGRLQESALDFVCIFGILGAIFGTIGAGQNYNAYPVLSLDNVVSGLTHSISGFASLYIMFARMMSMKKKNIVITLSILLSTCTLAYITNHIIDYNYMFLMHHDGTPYSIFYNLVNGNQILYPLVVVSLFIIYIAAFYNVYYLIKRKKGKS